MKKLTGEQARKSNLWAVCLCLAGALLSLALLSLPSYRFSATLYVKKSGNTFVGDERYTAALDQADAVAAEYRQSGLDDVRVTQEVTQRVNSKGETTSLITFRVNAMVSRNAWAFIASGLPCGKVMLAAVTAFGLALALLLFSLRGTLQKAPSALGKGRRTLRRVAGAFSLLALLLVPMFHFDTVRLFQRQILLGLSQPATPAFTALLGAADVLLFAGQGGAEIATLLSGLAYRSTAALWLLLPAMFLLLTGILLLTEDSLAHTLSRGLLYLGVIVICVVILYPYYVMLITGFRNNAETTDMYFGHMFPTQWVWSNMGDIINRGVLRFLLNSLLLSGGATLLALGCGIPAAYAMARMQFRGRKVFLGFVIMSQMFAPIVLLVGISQLMILLKLNDSLLGLMLINAAFNQAFAIWLLRGTFVSISPEMEQAACIDGCSTVSALWHVLLPMAAPGIVTTLIFVFINAWNEYTISTVLISTPFKKPITVGITQFSSFNMIEWQYLFASALLATIPVVILFMFIEKQLVSGLTSGGVKG